MEAEEGWLKFAGPPKDFLESRLSCFNIKTQRVI